MKASKQHIISDLLVLLTANTRYIDSYAHINAKTPMGRRTFDKYWKIAVAEHQEHNIAVQKELLKQDAALSRDFIKKAKLTKEDVLNKLLVIATKAKRDADKINSLRLICEIQGYKAPIQQHIEVENVTPIFWSNPLIDGLGTDQTTIDITHEEEPPPDQDQDEPEEDL